MLGSTSGCTAAVIVGADACGLGLARSLAQADIPVVVVDSDARRPALHSRYVWRSISPEIEGLGLVNSLLALSSQLASRPVLFLTSDAQVRTVSQHRDRLQQAYRIRLPDHDRVCQLLHKADFYALAKRHGFPVPNTLTVREPSDLLCLRRMRFPVVIKPANREDFSRGKSPRAVRADGPAMAETICRAILPAVPDLIVQEWVEGPDDNIYFCLQYYRDHGIAACSFTGRKLRCWPPAIGSTASCMPAPEVADDLEPLARDFFGITGFTGICSMEFKRDSRTGAFLMIEPTVGRADWQEEVASLNGVNIPLVAYQHELNLPVLTGHSTGKTVIWRHPSSYWRSLIASRSFGDRRPRGAEVRSSVWRLDDPLPLAFCWIEWLRKGVELSRWTHCFAPKVRTSAQQATTEIPDLSKRQSLL